MKRRHRRAGEWRRRGKATLGGRVRQHVGLAGQRDARDNGRMGRISAVHIFVSERGVERDEQCGRIGAVLGPCAHSRDERRSRDAGQAERVEITFDHIGAQFAPIQFGGNR